ncbi:MAG: hypothetical protein Q9169_003021 [Polycauliona sp. 2 TL-2023]
MGKPPAIVVIARHGARLDAADKLWHLSSPTPYDPPLTYGGWVQSRALGNRIASILHTTYGSGDGGNSNASAIIRDNALLDGSIDGHTTPTPDAGHEKKRAYKVVIHTSPFRRCIQTSIAISAGIAQYQGSIGTKSQSRPSKHHAMHSEAQHPTHPASPYLAGTENSTTHHLAAIPEPSIGNDSAKKVPQPVEQAKPCLRIDAFLGEWLSPEYFDMITPPPNSIMMLTGAKAELMKPGEYVDVPAGSYKSPTEKGNSSGLWGSLSSTTLDTRNEDDSGPLSTISSIGATLPALNRASSQSSANRPSPSHNNRKSPRSVSKIETSALSAKAGYEPPTPSYAVSPSGPIPPGYVAHARDACTEVDFQWDSMRQPHDWGDGGEYGEEWSAMHKRFRRGLQGMVAWYEHNDAGLTTPKTTNGSNAAPAGSYQADADTDIVLVLVTHGAGCNALLGTLTDQPVLLDVGMTSLTLAVRKEVSNKQARSPASADNSSQQSSSDSSVSNKYEVTITASTDHLHTRGRSSTVGMMRDSSTFTSSPTSYHRYRTNSAASTASSNSFTEGDFNIESEHRVLTSLDSGGDSSRSTSSSGGLWSKPVAKSMDWSGDGPHVEKAPFLNGRSPLAKEVSSDGKPNEDETGNIQKEIETGKARRAPDAPGTQPGLWGTLPASTTTKRENGPKRRWTHSEHR